MTIFEKLDTERHRRDINLCKPMQTIPKKIAQGESMPLAKSIGRIDPRKPAMLKGDEA